MSSYDRGTRIWDFPSLFVGRDILKMKVCFLFLFSFLIDVNVLSLCLTVRVLLFDVYRSYGDISQVGGICVP